MVESLDEPSGIPGIRVIAIEIGLEWRRSEAGSVPVQQLQGGPLPSMFAGGPDAIGLGHRLAVVDQLVRRRRCAHP
ncbi:MAG: hypothetical protein ACRDO2_07220, partial [Nocardioidaceae bacterium]